MKKYKVTFEVFRNSGSDRKTERKTIEVEAGNKKLAMTRAMMEIGKIPGYSELYKQVAGIEEVVA